MNILVNLQLGHRAVLKNKSSCDWTVFVRGSEGSDISHFVQKVMFYLADDHYQRPKRVVASPPYEVTEYGPCNFNLKITIFFKNDEEPKKIEYMYELYESFSSIVEHVRYEKLTFTNPVPDFRGKLLKAKKQAVGDTMDMKNNTTAKSSTSSDIDESDGIKIMDEDSATGSNSDMKIDNGKKRKSDEPSVIQVTKKKKMEIIHSDNLLEDLPMREQEIQKEVKELENIRLCLQKEVEKHENISKLIAFGSKSCSYQRVKEKALEMLDMTDTGTDNYFIGDQQQQTWMSRGQRTVMEATKEKPSSAQGKPTTAVRNPTAAQGKPPSTLEKTTTAFGMPAAAQGKPTTALGKTTPALGKLTTALGKPTTALGKLTVDQGKPTSPLKKATAAQGKLAAAQRRLAAAQVRLASSAPGKPVETQGKCAAAQAKLAAAQMKIAASSMGKPVETQAKLAAAQRKIAAAQVRLAVSAVGKSAEAQGKFSAAQGKLAAAQGRLAAEQGRLAAEKGKLAAEQGKLAAEHGMLSSAHGNTMTINGKQLTFGKSTTALGKPTEVNVKPPPLLKKTVTINGKTVTFKLRNPAATQGNPTTALGNSTTALGNPTTTLGKPTAALGKPTTELDKPYEAGESSNTSASTNKPTPEMSKPTKDTGKSKDMTSTVTAELPQTALTSESLVDESDQTYYHNKANESYNRMEEELTCPVCLELYNKPIMLPCSHSLCRQCLEDIAQSREKNGQEGIECPSCRKVLNLTSRHISRLPENLALKNTIFHFEQVSLHHQEIQSYRKKGETTNCCKDHSEEKVNMFCDQCKVLVCYLCVCDDQGQHTGHKVITKTAAASQIKETIKLKQSTIEPLVNTVKERSKKIDELCTDIENVHNRACKQIEVEYFAVLKELQNKKEAFIKTLTQEKTQAVYNLQLHEEQINSCLTNMEAMITSCQNILDESEIDEILTKAGELPSLSDLDDKMQKSESEFSELTRNCVVQKNITDAVDKFGTVLKECVKPLTTMGNGIPATSLEEKQAYLDKLQELSKYKQLLRRLINKCSSVKGEDNGKVMANMKQLLGILTDHTKQLPMEKLLQCEQVLKKISNANDI